MFHLLKYKRAAAAAGGANLDMVAVPDSVFSARGGAGGADHFIFSERYNLLAQAAMGVSVTDARWNIPHINSVARGHVWPFNRAATPPAHPKWHDLRNQPIPLPINEELAYEISNNLACGTEDETVFAWIAPPGWDRRMPVGEQRLIVAATAAAARVADAWSGLNPITFAENLRGGWYAVVGAWCQSANLRAFRLFFPRSPLVNGRQLRPGWFSTTALGDITFPGADDWLGHWGTFHSFELPQVEVYGDAAGADTQVLRLDVIYLGETAPAGYSPTGMSAM